MEDRILRFLLPRYLSEAPAKLVYSMKSREKVKLNSIMQVPEHIKSDYAKIVYTALKVRRMLQNKSVAADSSVLV